MSKFLRGLGAFIAIAGGLLGSILSLIVVYSEFGGIGGALLGLFLFPLTFTLIPFYTLLVYGSWTLLLISYGSIGITWFLAWIANEIEQRPEAQSAEPALKPAGGAAKNEASATPILLLIGGLIFVVVFSTLANPDFAPTSKGTPGPTIAPTKTQLPGPTPTQRLVSIHACVTNSTVNIRRGPGTQYETVNGMVPGACMSILGRNPDSSWVYIATEDNKTGWVAASLLTIEGDVTRVSVRSDSDGMSLAPTAIPSRLVSLCSESGNKIGEYISCKIERADCVHRSDIDDNPTFCHDRLYPNQGFQLVVVGEDWSNYDNSCIVISGYLETYQGVLQIQGFSRSQVSYCE